MKSLEDKRSWVFIISEGCKKLGLQVGRIREVGFIGWKDKRS